MPKASATGNTTGETSSKREHDCDGRGESEPPPNKRHKPHHLLEHQSVTSMCMCMYPCLPETRPVSRRRVAAPAYGMVGRGRQQKQTQTPLGLKFRFAPRLRLLSQLRIHGTARGNAKRRPQPTQFKDCHKQIPRRHQQLAAPALPLASPSRIREKAIAAASHCTHYPQQPNSKTNTTYQGMVDRFLNG